MCPSPLYLQGDISPIQGQYRLQQEYPDQFIVGIDEVGRGPLAGPVVACAVYLKDPSLDLGLQDSKKMSAKKRESLFESIQDASFCYAIAMATEQEIDSLNILQATFLAMRRALAAIGFPFLKEEPDKVPLSKGHLPSDSCLFAVDGPLKIKGLNPDLQISIVQGDSKIVSISAASVLAKVYRDRYMKNLSLEYPEYGFEKHAGYGTKMHREAIQKYGYSPVHRQSFKLKG